MTQLLEGPYFYLYFYRKWRKGINVRFIIVSGKLVYNSNTYHNLHTIVWKLAARDHKCDLKLSERLHTILVFAAIHFNILKHIPNHIVDFFLWVIELDSPDQFLVDANFHLRFHFSRTSKKGASSSNNPYILGVGAFPALEQSKTCWCVTGVPITLSGLVPVLVQWAPVTVTVQWALSGLVVWFDISLLDLLWDKHANGVSLNHPQKSFVKNTFALNSVVFARRFIVKNKQPAQKTKEKNVFSWVVTPVRPLVQATAEKTINLSKN